MSFEIRKAIHGDAAKIIQAHRRSIREVCSANYQPEQIEAWAGRNFREDRWQATMDRDQVWVISDSDQNIYGFGHLQFKSDATAEIAGLYFVPEIIGKGYGKKLAQVILSECKVKKILSIDLMATVTAQEFYKSIGFKTIGPMTSIDLGGQKIECFYMHLNLDTERWAPLSLDQVRETFKNSNQDYWISGGWAIDLFLGKQTRPHDDLDISIARNDQVYFQNILNGWDLRASDPPGSGVLRHWKPEEFLDRPVYNIWARKTVGDSWNLEIMLCDFENNEWVYRRNKEVRGPISEFGWKTQGFRVIAPEIQLLYKSRGSREKDHQDLRNCLPHFNIEQKERLKRWLVIDSSPTHPWVAEIN